MSITHSIRSIIVFVCLLTISNCTTLVADVNFNVAWGPQPANNATNVHYKAPDGNSITLSWQPGDSAKQHDVYFGTSASALVYQGSRYDANSDPLNWTIADFDFKLNTNYYWRFDETNDSSVLAQGLVWKFTTHDGKAYNPKPVTVNGATALSEPLQLSWTAGDWAQSTNGHRVFFGTDAGYVTIANTTTPKIYRGTVTNPSYPLTSVYPDYTLMPGTTYYWRIDEVNGTTVWKSNTWSFTPATYVTIDDFEDYNTTDELRANWETTYDTNCGAPMSNGTVKLVRDAEGKHMLVNYRNHGGDLRFTEIKRSYNNGTTFTGNNTLIPIPAVLSINYIGSATNSADPVYDRMYVAIQDTAGNIGVYLNPDAAAAQVTGWKAWNVNLRDINSAGVPSVVKLNDVNAFYIGFGVRCNFDSPSGDGNVMFDNIRLEPQTCDWGLIGGADFDGNCYVNMYDLALMTQFWLMDCPPSNPCMGTIVPFCPPPNICPQIVEYPVVDLTGDHIMDFKDFSILGMQWKGILLGP